MENELRLKEVQSSIIFYKDPKNVNDALRDGIIYNNTEKQIQDIINNLANGLVRGTKPPIFLPYTDTIGLSVYDIKTCNEDFEKRISEIRLAKYDDEMNLGVNAMLVSRDILFSFDQIIDKQLYLLDCIYKSFMSYFQKFGIETKGYTESYEKLKRIDFYFNYKKPIPYKKTNISASVQIQRDIDIDRFRFVLMDNVTKEILEIHNLPNRETSHKILDGVDLLGSKIPSFIYEIIGWKRDKFYFNWEGGSLLKDCFEYDIKTKTLKQALNMGNDFELYKNRSIKKIETENAKK